MHDLNVFLLIALVCTVIQAMPVPSSALVELAPRSNSFIKLTKRWEEEEESEGGGEEEFENNGSGGLGDLIPPGTNPFGAPPGLGVQPPGLGGMPPPGLGGMPPLGQGQPVVNMPMDNTGVLNGGGPVVPPQLDQQLQLQQQQQQQLLQQQQLQQQPVVQPFIQPQPPVQPFIQPQPPVQPFIQPPLPPQLQNNVQPLQPLQQNGPAGVIAPQRINGLKPGGYQTADGKKIKKIKKKKKKKKKKSNKKK